MVDNLVGLPVALLIKAVTLVGAGWLLAQTAALRRQWRLLGQVRTLFASDPLQGISPGEFPEQWAATSGLDLPQRWVAAERSARLLDESSQRFEAALQPFAAGLDRFSDQLRASADEFAHRLDNASHNILQSVEGMRAAAADLRQATAGFDHYYARIEAMYHRIETVASQVAGSQIQQQERLSEIAGGLFGITQSLTTVVASANETQRAVARMAGDVAGTALAVERSADRLDASFDQLVAEVQNAAQAAKDPPPSSTPPSPPSSTSTDGVTLRCIIEQQQQFINLLDHRLSNLDRTTSRCSAPVGVIAPADGSASEKQANSPPAPRRPRARQSSLPVADRRERADTRVVPGAVGWLSRLSRPA